MTAELVELVDTAKQGYLDGTAYRECRIREAAEKALHDAGENRGSESIAITFPLAFFSQPDPSVLLNGEEGRGRMASPPTSVTITVPTVLATYDEAGQLATETMLRAVLDACERIARRNEADARRAA